MKENENEPEKVENEPEMNSEEEVGEVENEEVETENGQEQVEVDELAELKDRHLRLYSEFENFRRRTAREKLDVIANANEDLMVELLPVLDDFERGIHAMEEAGESKEALQGMNLIYTKFKKSLEQNGLKPIEAGSGTSFDVELHEAISQIPAPNKKLQGKIIDVVEKGYFLKEKVIRFAKVVVGS